MINKGHLEKLLADKKLDEEKRKEYESVLGQVRFKVKVNNIRKQLKSKGPSMKVPIQEIITVFPKLYVFRVRNGTKCLLSLLFKLTNLVPRVSRARRDPGRSGHVLP